MIWQTILKFIVSELLGFISDKIREARALKKKAAEDKVLVKEALQEKDRKKRAQNISDLLNS
jgi:hypothetical protein